MKKLVVIAPTITPEICGVSGNALNLAIEFKKHHYDIVELGLQRFFGNGNVSIDKVDNWKNILNDNLAKRETIDILLNYTPRSYARLGINFGLLSSITKILRKNKKCRLYIIFHELWNDSTTLKLHHRIIGKFSKWFAFKLGSLSSGIIVMTNEQLAKLTMILPEKKTIVGKVGNNILPVIIDETLEQKRKDGVCIVFGLSHTRFWTLTKFQTLIKRLIELEFLKEIRLVGPYNDTYGNQEMQYLNTNFPGLKVARLGDLNNDEVSKELLKASVALVGQNVDSISKSSSFLAIVAHSLPVICDLPKTLLDPPGLAIFRPEDFLENANAFDKECIMRADILYKWYYRTRSWQVITDDIYQFIIKNKPVL